LPAVVAEPSSFSIAASELTHKTGETNKENTKANQAARPFEWSLPETIIFKRIAKNQNPAITYAAVKFIAAPNTVAKNRMAGSNTNAEKCLAARKMKLISRDSVDF